MKLKKTHLACLAVTATLLATSASAQMSPIQQQNNLAAMNSAKDLHAQMLYKTANTDCVARSSDGMGACFGVSYNHFATENRRGTADAATAVASYAFLENFRVGVTYTGPQGSEIPFGKSMEMKPIFGLFANWSQSGTMDGLNVRLAAAREIESTKYLTETRVPTFMHGDTALIEANRGFTTSSGMFGQPYFGVRTMGFNNSNPLGAVYPALRSSQQEAVLLGYRGMYPINEQFSLGFSLGLERDLGQGDTKSTARYGADERTRYTGNLTLSMKTGTGGKLVVGAGFADQAWNTGKTVMLTAAYQHAF